MKRIFFIILSLTIPILAHAFTIRDYCAGLPSGDIVEIYAYDMDDAAVDRNWTSAGVTERSNGDGTSTYWFTLSVDAGHAYDVKCRTTQASTQRTVKYGISQTRTSIDSILSSRMSATATPNVTVTQNNDKTGYALLVTPPTASQVTAAVWDVPMVNHVTSGTTGGYMVLTALDPWSFSVAGAYPAGTAGYLLGDTIAPRMDAAVSSRLAAASYTTPPSAASNATAVWNEATAGHQGVGTTGLALTAASSAGDPWNSAIPGGYGAGTAGYIVGNRIDAAISTRLATAGYTVPPTTTQIHTALPELAMLDATISSRSTFTGNLNSADITAIKTQTDKMLFDADSKIVSATTATISIDAAEIASQFLDAAVAGHLTSGSVGERINSAASAGDPWATDPSAYAIGTAGYKLTNMPTAVSGEVVGSTVARGVIDSTVVVKDRDIRITRGDDKMLSFSFGAQWVLSAGDAIWFAYKPSLASTTATAEAQATITTPTTATGYVLLTSVQTSAAGSYWYEFERITAAGLHGTIQRGRLIIEQDVRR